MGGYFEFVRLCDPLDTCRQSHSTYENVVSKAVAAATTQFRRPLRVLTTGGAWNRNCWVGPISNPRASPGRDIYAPIAPSVCESGHHRRGDGLRHLRCT